MKHADFQKHHADFASKRSAFDEMAKKEQRRYLVRASVGEVIETVVTPQPDGTVGFQIFQLFFGVTGRNGSTELTNRPVSSFSAADLTAIANAKSTVDKWVKGEIGTLPPSTATDEVYKKATPVPPAPPPPVDAPK